MSNQFGDTRIDDDLTLLSETLEEVLRSSGDPADQKYVELKARAEKALDDVKNGLARLQTVITIGRSRLFIVLMTTSTKTLARNWCGRGRWAGTRTVAGTPLKPPYTGVLHFFVVPRIM